MTTTEPAEERDRRATAGGFLTVSEAANALSLSPTSVQLLVERGVLKAWKTAGGHRRILPDSVKDLLRERGLEEPAGAREDSAVPVPAPTTLSPTLEMETVPLDVLIAEDDEFLGRLYEAKLRSIGFPVQLRFARDGVQALLALGNRVPDALILDIGLPGLDGIETLRALRQDARTAKLPVAIVSGMRRDQITAMGPLPAGVAIFGKPVPFERLTGYLEALFGLKQARHGEPSAITGGNSL